LSSGYCRKTETETETENETETPTETGSLKTAKHFGHAAKGAST